MEHPVVHLAYEDAVAYAVGGKRLPPPMNGKWRHVVV